MHVRFHVAAPSVNSVRKALFRAPGGARVVGRFDRALIECRHTMDERSLAKNWPIIVQRLADAGLPIVPLPAESPPKARDFDDAWP